MMIPTMIPVNERTIPIKRELCTLNCESAENDIHKQRNHSYNQVIKYVFPGPTHREDELSSLLQITLCSETSLQVSGVQPSLRIRRICWSVGNLIGYDDSIWPQWKSPRDVDLYDANKSPTG